ncbi:hypothetical protein Cantr_07878 [Candida viswanathii]|uniref:Uncharacterized protein n=1 Tax=Candida viswanathii TaxID=5486 RepID=A0A367Y1P1_9ASCO|nr:hypothetical protein Cantr_07878 [Candida viswanathii]
MSTSKPSTPVSSPKVLHPPTISSIIQPQPPVPVPVPQPPTTPPHSRTKRRSYGVFESPDRQKDGHNDLSVPSLPFTPSTKRRSYGLFESPVGKSPYGVALKTPRNDDDNDSPEQDEDKKLKLQRTPQFSSAKRLYDTLNSAMSRSPNIFAGSKNSISYRDQLQSTSPTKASPIKFPTTPSPPNSKHHSGASQTPSLPFTPSTKRRSYGLFESPVSKSPSSVPLDTPINDEVDAKEAIKKMLEKRNGGVAGKPKINPNSLTMDKENIHHHHHHHHLHLRQASTASSSSNSTPTPNLPALKLPSLDSKFTEREAAFSLVKLQSVTGHEDDTETEDEEDF